MNLDNNAPYIITYVDHVLYKRIDPSQVENSIRVTVGWIVKQDHESICISWDFPLHQQCNEVECPHSGLSLVRSAVLEIIPISGNFKGFLPCPR